MEVKNNLKDKKSFFQKNIIFLVLGFLSLGIIVVNQYDRLNSGKIEITVDENRDTNLNENEYMKIVGIYVYNPNSKSIELKEIQLPKRDLLEGEYISAIINSSSYLNEEMKFLSSYILNIDGVETMIIKVNNEFLDIKKNNEIYNGFLESVKRTMLSTNANIHDIQVQIDGDKVTQ